MVCGTISQWEKTQYLVKARHSRRERVKKIGRRAKHKKKVSDKARCRLLSFESKQ